MKLIEDPTMHVVRRALRSGPKTIAAIAETLRRDSGEGDTPEFIRDSLNEVLTCMLESGCRPNIETDAQRVAIEHELRRKWDDVRPIWAQIAITEVVWLSPSQINSANPVGKEAYAR